jgi:hypothetical protein
MVGRPFHNLRGMVLMGGYIKVKKRNTLISTHNDGLFMDIIAFCSYTFNF